jgi:hypothetical protein
MREGDSSHAPLSTRFSSLTPGLTAHGGAHATDLIEGGADSLRFAFGKPAKLFAQRDLSFQFGNGALGDGKRASIPRRYCLGRRPQLA